MVSPIPSFILNMAQLEWILALVLIWFSNTIRFSNAHERECSRGLKTPGYTDPYGDIVIEYGNSLEITCVLNNRYVTQYGPNASMNLYFVRGTDEIPDEMIEVLNSSSIRLHIDKPPKSSSVYTCKLRNGTDAVCINNVIIGTKPLPVEDFQCIGYNYENLTCSWTPPENYVKTTYNLTYFFPGRAGRLLRNVCPSIAPLPGPGKKLSCLWTILTEPQYRQVQRTFNFELNITNCFGTRILNKTFSHFPHVLSGPPENLTYINTTATSIFLQWSVPISMQAFPPGLQHRILYRTVYDDDWKFGGMIKTLTSREMKRVRFNLTGLPYAHTLYDIRVSMRSDAAEPDDESMWSNNSSQTIITMSTVPGAPPLTNIGSFEIVSSGTLLSKREVFIYWRLIPVEITNGDNFEYYVTIEGDSRHEMSLTSTQAYVWFQHLSINENYTFHIWSKNEVGISVKKSVVYVPSQFDRIPEPTSFIKTAFGGGKYELSWKAPRSDFSAIKNYTIFWCMNDKDRPYQCKGYLNWTEISSDLTVYNITVSDEKLYQFAISANGEKFSSGMVWASCTILHDKVIGKMSNVQVSNVYSNAIELLWKLDCNDGIGSVEGFVIYYCNIESPSSTNCKGPEQNLTIMDSTIEKLNITGLVPYRTYMLTIAAITKHNTQSQRSEFVMATTFEGAPNPPMNVNVTEVSNSSISIAWQRPQITNGKLKYYNVIYNNIVEKVKSEEEMYTIYNLSSYCNYTVTIVACTVECSKPSEPQMIRTKGGYPSKPMQPGVTFQNDSFILIEWEPPLEPRGKVNIYEVSFKEKLENENKTSDIVNVTGTRYAIDDCGAGGKYNTFYISIRAVNIFNGNRYAGAWSDELESFCHATSLPWLWLLIPISILFLLALFYMSKKIYFHCKDMRNVEVKLPSGLAPVVVGDIGLTHWGNPKIQEDPDRHISADEESLLVKIGDSRNVNGDSSGCSSGHESVTSSLESTTHLSNTSDSGTEQPRSSSTEDLRKNSLRLRNVAASRPVVSKGYVTMPPDAGNTTVWGPKTTTPGNYCVLGVDPTPLASITPSYVQQSDNPKLPYNLPDTSSQTTPYVAAVDCNITANPNYVPLNAVEDTENTPAYVMAGNKGISVPDLLRLDSIKTVNMDDKPLYVQVSDTPNNIRKNIPDALVWHQPPLDPELNKTSYVSIGDVPAPRLGVESKKGYVPHRHFDAKTLKED